MIEGCNHLIRDVEPQHNSCIASYNERSTNLASLLHHITDKKRKKMLIVLISDRLQVQKIRKQHR